MNIRDVSGKILNVYCTRRLRVLLDGTSKRSSPFVVADVTRPIDTLGKLTKQDFTVHQMEPIACDGVTDAPAAAVPHVPAVEAEDPQKIRSS